STHVFPRFSFLLPLSHTCSHYTSSPNISALSLHHALPISTTIKLILNMLKRNGGEIKIMGLDNVADEQKAKAELGVVFDTNYFRSEEHTSELQSRFELVCRLLLEKKKSVIEDGYMCISIIN